MVDTISILPDSILCDILSFLPTKQAVATSVLSKRWKPLWLSVPTLDFDHVLLYNNEDSARFVQSVYAVILFRDQHQPIHKFRLNCANCDHLDVVNVNAWLHAAVQRRIHHLDISLSFDQPKSFISPVIFSCKTLVVLKLQGVTLKPLDSTVDLPLLKILHLQQVFFKNRGCLAELLTGCPVLEDFKADNYGSATQVTTSKEFQTLPKLVRAEISVIPAPSLMIVVNNVKFLHLHWFGGWIWKLYCHGRDKYLQFFSMFHNLTRLELSYLHCYNDGYQVVEFLMNCPKLQVLVINQPHYEKCACDGIEEVGDLQYPSSVPECILLHLISCCLNDYRGNKGEFQFARYILQNGRLLERMTICSDSTVNRQRKHKNFKQLSSCTRHSATCKLSLK
ncbi:FBD-associated F-box protein At4g10400-like [Lotus japonicus]|uniref:FBD-associated F-box protein At4g10400-like n=1 Tax=Lotus japonicus TaxID=34305 RepID=UPI00258595ED|nr:FBD-associated F-box protein At4g10400-like [Lotus japonicus]